MGFAHQARAVISLRGLDTGTAKDISGVLRVSRGGVEKQVGEDEVEETELLYFVSGDMGVKVFERGGG